MWVKLFFKNNFHTNGTVQRKKDPADCGVFLLMRYGAFAKSVSKEVVKQIQTDDNGYFKNKLKPGCYIICQKRRPVLFQPVRRKV